MLDGPGGAVQHVSVRNIIVGGIGVLWGGGILVSALLRGGPDGSGSYAAGHSAGLALGALLLIVGAYYVFQGIRKAE
jgi:hypothetical protein